MRRVEQSLLFVFLQAAVTLVEVGRSFHAGHGAVRDGDAPGVDGDAADGREQVYFAVHSCTCDRLATVVDVVVEVGGQKVGESLEHEAGRHRRRAHLLARRLAEPLGRVAGVGVRVRRVCLGNVHARQPSVFQDGVDDVALDLEALVARRLFAQVTRQQVAEAHAPRLAVVDEQTLSALRLHALLDVDGLLLRVGEQALVEAADLPDAHREAVVQARRLRLEALVLQLGDIRLHRLDGAVGEGLGEVVAVLNRDLEPRAVLDGSHDVAPSVVEQGL